MKIIVLEHGRKILWQVRKYLFLPGRVNGEKAMHFKIAMEVEETVGNLKVPGKACFLLVYIKMTFVHRP